MKKTLLALLLTVAGIAGLSAQTTDEPPEPIRTVKPEEVPVMNPIEMTRIVFSMIDDDQGYINMGYDTDGDGIEDARFVYGYIFVEGNVMDTGLIMYAFDEDRNSYFDANEWITIDYSEDLLPKPIQPPESQEVPFDNGFWNEYFEPREREGVGV